MKFFAKFFKTVGFLGLLSLGIGSLVAQTQIPTTGPEAPTAPALVLPELVLDLDNPDLQAVPGLLPAIEDLGFQGLGDDVPLVGRLDLGPEIYAQLLGPSPDRQLPVVASDSRNFDSVYTRGSVGVGLHQMLSGGVSIYQLGTNPELRFDFSHRYLDGAILGTEWKNAGEGYKEQFSQFFGDLGLRSPRGSGGIEVEYSLEETGFQNRIPDYFGATVQDLRIVPRSSLPLSSSWTGILAAEYSYVRRFYGGLGSGSSDYDARVWGVSPHLGLEYENENLEAEISLEYRLRSNPQETYENLLRPEARIQWQALSWVGIGASIGGVFDFEGLTKVPFEIDLVFDPVDEVSINLVGGYEVATTGVEEIWTDLPTLGAEGSGEFSYESWWTADLVTRFFPGDTLDIELGMNLQSYDTKLNIENLSDTSNPVNLWSLESFTQVRTSAQLNFRPITELILSMGWIGHFLDQEPLVPEHQIDLRLEYRHSEGQYGGILQTLFPIDPDDTTPRLNLTGWLSLGRVVEIEASFIDPFSLFLPQGRSAHPGLTPFKETGFRAEMLVALSL